MDDYQQSPLWRQAFRHQGDGLDTVRNRLTIEFGKFRDRVSLLVAHIHKDMPSLTVHDITHVDALWWTASEIAGSDWALNPAEAFVLGGAFLLHDAAHCIAAYPGGIDEIRKLPEWDHFSAKLGTAPDALLLGSEQFQLVLFDVLRVMHPKQARLLPKLHWSAPGDLTPLYLLPDEDLREAYGDVIGQLSESHWWWPHELEALSHRSVNPPAWLHPAPWIVDILKLAVLLRTADAAHIDAQRAPRFLFALVQPGGSSLAHWQFQARLHNVKRDPDPTRNDLCVSGSTFPPSEQDAWWMAYDAARMIDNATNCELLIVFFRIITEKDWPPDQLRFHTARKRFHKTSRQTAGSQSTRVSRSLTSSPWLNDSVARNCTAPTRQRHSANCCKTASMLFMPAADLAD